MAMSRKHFEAIAATLRDARITPTDSEISPFDEGFNEGSLAASSKIARGLADYFATENPNFDRQRFLKACGL